MILYFGFAQSTVMQKQTNLGGGTVALRDSIEFYNVPVEFWPLDPPNSSKPLVGLLIG